MHEPILNRRNFLVASAAAAVLANQAPARAQEFKTKLHKAMIIGPATEHTLEPIKEAGFEGVETHHICDEAEAAKLKGNADKVGLRIHSVMRGWAEFNSDDPKKVEESMNQTRKALRAAKAYGADDILLVPCRIGGIVMPEPWEFDIEFDEKTGHVSRVVAGDNSKFEAYIAAQNKATDTSRAAVEKLIPLAEELKIIIGLENVWNNLWVQPAIYKNFVASFNHPYVKSYFDVGNQVKYSKTPVQDWIKLLGSLIIRVHVKDYKLAPDGHSGTFVHLPEGSIDWRAVRQALEDVGYSGWVSIEESGLPYKEFARRFDAFADAK